MIKIFGYGEDTLTLWTLKNRTSEVLMLLNDKSNPLSTLLFFRPSFGRRGGMKRAEFGEFDAIFASSKNVYLIESKWDKLSGFKNDKIALRQEQIIRHEIFSWYLTNWVKDKYFNWTEFHDALKIDFKNKFPSKKIAPIGSLLADNLQFVLNEIQKHFEKFSYDSYDFKIRNVLLFFYNKNKSVPPNKINASFELVNIDYSQNMTNNFIALD